MCAGVCVLSHIQLFATPWTVAHQAPLYIEFFRQEDCSGLPFPTPKSVNICIKCTFIETEHRRVVIGMEALTD